MRAFFLRLKNSWTWQPTLEHSGVFKRNVSPMMHCHIHAVNITLSIGSSYTACKSPLSTPEKTSSKNTCTSLSAFQWQSSVWTVITLRTPWSKCYSTATSMERPRRAQCTCDMCVHLQRCDQSCNDISPWKRSKLFTITRQCLAGESVEDQLSWSVLQPVY